MIVNVSGYRFVDLPDRDELREPMLEHCLGLGLKGTVLSESQRDQLLPRWHSRGHRLLPAAPRVRRPLRRHPDQGQSHRLPAVPQDARQTQAGNNCSRKEGH